MREKLVKDLMIPLNNYAIIHEEATVAEAVSKLKQRQKDFTPGKHLPRALLVVNADGEITGQLEYFDFLKALEPKYNLLGDLGTLSRAGVSNEIVSSMMENLKFWEMELIDACRRASSIKVKSLARPIAESIDEDSTLQLAIHKILLLQSMRILVTRGAAVVGILRLADIFDELCNYMNKHDYNTL